MTWVGVSVLLAAVVAGTAGSASQAAYGVVLGAAIIVFSEWNRWRTGSWHWLSTPNQDMRRPVRHPNLILGFTIAPLTFALVWSLTHGQIVGAVIAGVLWTFYGAVAVSAVVVSRRQRSNGGARQPPPD